jgi:hypothetical protein
MDQVTPEKPNNCLPPVSNAGAAIRHFQISLASGKHWYLALLESIGLWTDETEEFQQQHYRYLIEGEAFDWLLLAERLCESVNGRIPEDEKYSLLFQGQPPLPITIEEFRKFIGDGKYHQFLNFFYGITVEEALVQAVREEVRKERRANGWRYQTGEEDETFTRIYGETEIALLKKFRREKHFPQNSNSSLAERKEFTYWCFKFRVRESEKARVASDTHKGLDWLAKNSYRF